MAVYFGSYDDVEKFVFINHEFNDLLNTISIQKNKKKKVSEFNLFDAITNEQYNMDLLIRQFIDKNTGNNVDEKLTQYLLSSTNIQNELITVFKQNSNNDEIKLRALLDSITNSYHFFKFDKSKVFNLTPLSKKLARKLDPLNYDNAIAVPPYVAESRNIIRNAMSVFPIGQFNEDMFTLLRRAYKIFKLANNKILNKIYDFQSLDTQNDEEILNYVTDFFKDKIALNRRFPIYKNEQVHDNVKYNDENAMFTLSYLTSLATMDSNELNRLNTDTLIITNEETNEYGVRMILLGFLSANYVPCIELSNLNYVFNKYIDEFKENILSQLDKTIDSEQNRQEHINRCIVAYRKNSAVNQNNDLHWFIMNEMHNLVKKCTNDIIHTYYAYQCQQKIILHFRQIFEFSTDITNLHDVISGAGIYDFISKHSKELMDINNGKWLDIFNIQSDKKGTDKLMKDLCDDNIINFSDILNTKEKHNFEKKNETFVPLQTDVYEEFDKSLTDDLRAYVRLLLSRQAITGLYISQILEQLKK